MCLTLVAHNNPEKGPLKGTRVIGGLEGYRMETSRSKARQWEHTLLLLVKKTGPDPHGGYLLPGSFEENASALYESWNINQIMHLSSGGFNAPGKRWKPLRRKRPYAPDNCSFCWVRGPGSKCQVSNSFQSLVIVLELTQASRQVPFPQGIRGIPCSAMEYELVRPGREGQECKMQVLDSQNQSLGSKRPLRAEKPQGSALPPRVSPSPQHATYWKGLTSPALSNFFEKTHNSVTCWTG